MGPLCPVVESKSVVEHMLRARIDGLDEGAQSG